LLNYIPTPNIPVTNVAGHNFNYHFASESPGLSNRLNVNISQSNFLETEPAGELQPQHGSSAFAEQFSGNRGKHIHARQSVMIGLTQNWTKTFLHTSQFYFSRNRSLGLNEFSNLTDIRGVIRMKAQLRTVCGRISKLNFVLRQAEKKIRKSLRCKAPRVLADWQSAGKATAFRGVNCLSSIP